MLRIFCILKRPSADAAEGCAGDERYQRAGAVDVFAQGVKPLAYGLARAEVDGVERKLLSADPEEHDRGDKRAERADVYRNDIHPLGHDGLNTQRDRAAENVNDRRCRNALELKLLLQKRNRRFVEIYYRAYAGKAHAHEEHYADYPSAGHAVDDVDEEDEHKSGAAGVELSAAGRHGRDDDKRRKQRRERIEYRNIARRRGDALLAAEIRAVNDASVAGNRQREERLTEGVYPQLGVCKTLGIYGEDIFISVRRAVERENIHAQRKKQRKQHRHHDLVGLFYAAGNAEGHYGKACGYCDDDPYVRAPCACRSSECAVYDVHILSHGKQIAGEGQECVFKYPAHNAGVAYSERERAEDGYVAYALADLALAVSKLGAHAERAHRACAAGAAEGKFLNNAGGRDEDDKYKVREQEGQASPCRDQHREAPYVSHADCGAYAGDDKAAAASEAVALVFVFLHCSYLSLSILTRFSKYTL